MIEIWWIVDSNAWDERVAVAAAVEAVSNDIDDDSWHWSVPDLNYLDVALNVRTVMMVISYYTADVYYIYGTIICAECLWCRRERTMWKEKSWLFCVVDDGHMEDKLQIIMITINIIFHFHNISLLFFVISAVLLALMPRTRLSWINLSALTKMPCFGRQLK